MTRRRIYLRRATSVALVLAASLGFLAPPASAAEPSEQVIKVVAKKFDYTPSQLTLKKGVPVVLELTTEDIVMGLNVPDLGVRADIVPGKVTRLRIVPQKTGTFDFFCDIFCGSGHEEMTGTIVVIE